MQCRCFACDWIGNQASPLLASFTPEPGTIMPAGYCPDCTDEKESPVLVYPDTPQSALYHFAGPLRSAAKALVDLIGDNDSGQPLVHALRVAIVKAGG